MKNITSVFFIMFTFGLLCVKAQGPILWGVTDGDSYNGAGSCIYNYNITTGIETVAYRFDTFTYPMGALLKGNNGLLYGTTLDGGTYYGGTLYSFNTSTGVHTVLHNFGSGTDGFQPTGQLVQASNGLIYGLTGNGGKYYVPPTSLGELTPSTGIIFSYDVATGTYSDVHDFGLGYDGMVPTGGLIQANNGILYGTTVQGGIYNGGTIFSYDISANTYSSLYWFGNTSTAPVFPAGSLLQAANGVLYGMTSWGGTDSTLTDTFGFSLPNPGTIFSYDIDNNTLNVVLNFGWNGDGGYPTDAMIQVGNGLLYGIASGDLLCCGMPGSGGTIFSFDITNDSEQVLYYGGEGVWPHGSLFQASNGLLYSTSPEGEVAPDSTTGGVIFSYDITTGVETVLHQFGLGTDALNPSGNLIEDDYPTGISKIIPDNNISVYPNPLQVGSWKLEVGSEYIGAQVEILDADGRVVYKFQITKTQSEVRAPVASGVYLLRMITSNEAITKKLVKL